MEILIESSLQKFVIGDNLKLSALVVFSDELLLVFGKDSLEDICEIFDKNVLGLNDFGDLIPNIGQLFVD